MRAVTYFKMGKNKNSAFWGLLSLLAWHQFSYKWGKADLLKFSKSSQSHQYVSWQVARCHRYSFPCNSSVERSSSSILPCSIFSANPLTDCTMYFLSMDLVRKPCWAHKSFSSFVIYIIHSTRAQNNLIWKRG